MSSQVLNLKEEIVGQFTSMRSEDSAGKRRLSWLRRLMSPLICIGAGWLIYLGAMSLMPWYFARDYVRKHPNLATLPSPSKVDALAPLHGDRFSRFGLSFQLPWSHPEREVDGKSVLALTFSNVGLAVLDPAGTVDEVSTMKGTTLKQQSTMEAVFGGKTLKTNYDLMAAEVITTPADVRWWAGRRMNTRNFILLTDKAMSLGNAKAIYGVQTAWLRGFQFGDPAVAPSTVRLDLFDDHDKHYQVLLSGKDALRPSFTQAEVNSVVESMMSTER